ncbi:MAG: MerR family transcriptional regulator [Gemmobacter sp.]
MEKSPDAFRTISEVADHLDMPAHVLRFWESRFPQIRPVKRAGGRRYYRPSDVALLSGIRRLLHDEGMTIRGVQKILREQGVRHVAGLTEEDLAADEAVTAPPAPKPARKAVAPSAPIPFPMAVAPPPPVEPQPVEPPPVEPQPVELQPDPPPAPAQLALFGDEADSGSVDPASEHDTLPDLAARLRGLPRGGLAHRRDALLALAERMRALADLMAARLRDPRL